MPRGFTDSVAKATEAFEELKKESFMKGRNVATITNVARRSGTSRTNLYQKKSEDWRRLASNIEEFARDFERSKKGRRDDPRITALRKEIGEWKKKYLKMAGQNYELMKRIDELERILQEKRRTIDWLRKRLEERDPL